MRGVIYVAYGEPALECLGVSLGSVQRLYSGIGVLVLSDQEIPGVPTQIVKSEDVGARSIKTRLAEFVPPRWDRVLYLDADTQVLKELNRFWGPLRRGWDIVFCRDETASDVRDCRLRSRKELSYTVGQLGISEVAQLAGGAIAWNVNKATERFFKVWHHEWKQFKRRDQGALTRALARVPLKMWTLPYNANAKYLAEAEEIWHRHGMARQRGSP